MQGGGYDLGFHEILGHSPPAPPQTKEFLLKHLIYKVFSCEMRMKSAGFRNYELLRHDQV